MTTRFRELLTRALGRELGPGDEIPRERLATAEHRLGFPLPEVMADFYMRAGGAPEFQAHSSLRAPEALEVEAGFLIFMEENQRVVDWGIPLPVDSDRDPIVWQCVNCDPPEFYSEEMPFSEFIVRILAFTRGTDLPDDPW